MFGEGEHVHEFGEDWAFDDDSHWKECECGERFEEGEHSYGKWKVTKDATETEEGVMTQTCEICGCEQTKSIDKLTHEYGEEWKNDANGHWHICLNCGEPSEMEDHKFGEWKVTKEATETEEGSRERTCDVCGYKQNEILPKLEPADTEKPAETEKPADTEKPAETEKPADNNPGTGVAANTSLLVLSACGVAAAFALKRKKAK